MPDLKKKVNQTVAALCVFPKKPVKKSRLREDLGFDSLRMVELIIALEDAFHIQIDESDMNPQDLIAMDDLYKLVNLYVGDDQLAVESAARKIS